MNPVEQSLILCPQCKRGFTPEERAALSPPRCSGCGLPLLVLADKYELVEELGQGGHGVVYLARHKDLPINPLRAIKFLSPDIQNDAIPQQRFAQEFRIMAGISQSSEHIVRVYDDFGEVPDFGHFYVMEYLHGEDLYQFIQRHKEPPPLQTSLSIVHQICLALEVAHREDVIHRDIKPENVLLIERDGNPHFTKVADFGIAKLLNAEKLTGPGAGVVGTPLYMPPEQILTQDQDGRSDIYSVGVLLYELTVGHHPFIPPEEKRPSIVKLIRAHLEETPPAPNVQRPGCLPPALEELVMRCLAKEPDDRVQTVSEIKQVLAEQMAAVVRGSAGLSPREVLQGLPPDSTDESLPKLPPEIAQTFAKATPLDSTSMATPQAHMRLPTDVLHPPEENPSSHPLGPLASWLQDDKRRIWWILALSGLLLIGGGLFTLWTPTANQATNENTGITDATEAQPRLWRNVPTKQKTPNRTEGCPLDTKKGMWLRVQTNPKDATLKTKRPVLRRKGWYCVLQALPPKSLTMTITSKAFLPCVVTHTLRKRATQLTLEPDDGAPSRPKKPDYCFSP